MRVLFVSPVFPQDPSQNVYGIFQRMRIWLDAIQSLEADLDILFLPPNGVDIGPESAAAVAQQLGESWGIHSNVVLCAREPRVKEGLASYVSTCVRTALGLSRHPYLRAYTGERQRETFAQCMARSPDIVFFQRIYAMGPSMSFSLSGVRVFLDLDDVEHLRFAREIRQPPHWRSKKLAYFLVPGLWRDERAAIARSNLAFVCSEVDRLYVRRVMRVRNIEVIPNAVPRVDDGPLSTDPNVLFIGNGLYGPNMVAAEYLIRKVWPRLARSCPKARLLIAGPGWDGIPSFQDPPSGVEFLGFVTDLDSLYRRTRVLCCPIQSGSGTRIKILEAANYGVPVVTTPLGAEGIELVPDAEIVLRNDATGMADACAELLVDDLRAHRIGVSARERVRALYSHDAIVSRIKTILAGEAAFDEYGSRSPR